jgi:amidase
VLEDAVDAVEAAGAHVDRRRRPAVDVAAAWRLGVRLVGAAFSVDPAEDPGLTHQQWLYMHRARADLRAAWAAVFSAVDIVLCPVTIVAAFAHMGGALRDRHVDVNGVARPYMELEAWPAIVGAAYLPSTATPVGTTDDGLPVGLQVVAPYLHDRRAIRVAGLVAECCADLGGGFRVAPVT